MLTDDAALPPCAVVGCAERHASAASSVWIAASESEVVSRWRASRGGLVGEGLEIEIDTRSRIDRCCRIFLRAVLPDFFLIVRSPPCQNTAHPNVNRAPDDLQTHQIESRQTENRDSTFVYFTIFICKPRTNQHHNHGHDLESSREPVTIGINLPCEATTSQIRLATFKSALQSANTTIRVPPSILISAQPSSGHTSSPHPPSISSQSYVYDRVSRGSSNISSSPPGNGAAPPGQAVGHRSRA